MSDTMHQIAELCFSKTSTFHKSNEQVAHDDEQAVEENLHVQLPDHQQSLLTTASNRNNKHNKHFLFAIAVASNSIQLIKELISQHENFNIFDKQGRTLVHWSVACGNAEILETLLKNGASTSIPDNFGIYPIHYSTQLKCTETSEKILSILLKYGSSPNVTDSENQTPLIWSALSSDNVSVAKRLLDAGGNALVRNKDSLTALHCAASHGNVQFLHLLFKYIESSSVVNISDRNGCTPLFYAVAYGHIECASCLLENGASVNYKDHSGKTVGHYAVIKSQLQILSILYDYGANVDAKDNFGCTLLHEATQAGNLEIVQWLIERSGSIDDKDSRGRTPWQIANANKDRSLCNILKCTESQLNSIAAEDADPFSLCNNFLEKKEQSFLNKEEQAFYYTIYQRLGSDLKLPNGQHHFYPLKEKQCFDNKLCCNEKNDYANDECKVNIPNTAETTKVITITTETKLNEPVPTSSGKIETLHDVADYARKLTSNGLSIFKEENENNSYIQIIKHSTRQNGENCNRRDDDFYNTRLAEQCLKEQSQKDWQNDHHQLYIKCSHSSNDKQKKQLDDTHTESNTYDERENERKLFSLNFDEKNTDGCCSTLSSQIKNTTLCRPELQTFSAKQYLNLSVPKKVERLIMHELCNLHKIEDFCAKIKEDIIVKTMIKSFLNNFKSVTGQCVADFPKFSTFKSWERALNDNLNWIRNAERISQKQAEHQKNCMLCLLKDEKHCWGIFKNLYDHKHVSNSRKPFCNIT
ncbi:Serine/threonine-protein phosphatase 6 regulatory ankyrin repeat subunit C [Trichinella pseudospiralis]|uniref:Serine/threonine-protein phosphatase 6 regulatory ankyrin repeat subunit C n=2 Tax=Trichinella pseudospiralis TaxID=6337 RepID=A0A0V1EKK9_TRIPS|nr:Serine/threonine-protein phosphatase 6 regulatory ankyrin repeat subunit C [Trichinella pseudospiralis]